MARVKTAPANHQNSSHSSNVLYRWTLMDIILHEERGRMCREEEWKNQINVLFSSCTVYLGDFWLYF